jgi:chaperonin GroES
VVVRLKEIPVVSQHIILTETVEERFSGFAKVIAVGTGAINSKGERVPIDLSPGDVVLLPPYKGAPWEDDGVEYHIVDINDVMGVSK